ncbi:hypothetical protein [Kibdelosporangium phytohabitans]|uniref:Uncharacterized protein n=1 Tax=Kibdelosporangium phytohabitans TaxID=860235 RepID=A0A0N9I6Q0_9PSEU|nr:hypothetical protein [Kibdelosporangium phytohabitans]ALG10278.1 hypothetical protein AOZ06_28310 [Kibdelosporangium phytohabitans]MBE1461308.1 hypothetical protein [Kibdelosporangium phytohabitans]
MNLEQRVLGLLRRARGAHPGETGLDDALAGVGEPLTIAITGGPGAATVREILTDQSFHIGPATTADAVLHLFPHTPDVHIPAQARDQSVIGVLTHADEIGGGRLDALTSARRIARRYTADPRLRGVCQTVVPVAGLLARTALTLTPSELDRLTDLASRPRADIDAQLLSVDRIRSTAPDLLDRFGLFGIRLGVTLVRQGFADRDALAAELVTRSGLADLRTQIGTRFCERSHVLKARSALAFLDDFLRRAGDRVLRAEVERLTAGAHEFVEVRTLDAVRANQIPLPSDVAGEVERLLGGDGATITSRLGVRGDPGKLRAAALRALRQWRVRAENPVAGRQFVETAQVVVRTCEGMVARLT